MRYMKIWQKIVLFILVILVGGISFISYQYFQSLAEVKSKQSTVIAKEDSFNGQVASDINDINVLFIGADSRGEDRGRSDTLMIAHYDQEKKEPKLVSIMRDSYVNIPGYGMDKINAAYSYGGAELVRKTIEENFGVPIQYYVIVDFTGFVDIVNVLFPKGVKIDAEKDLELDGVSIKAGEQKMDGNTLLQYSRFRGDEESDFGRIRRQQQVLSAIAQQADDITSLTKLPTIAGKAVGYTSTNLPTTKIVSLAKEFVFGEAKKVQTLSVPVEGSWSSDDSTEAGDVLRIDDLELNKTDIDKFLDDEENSSEN